MKPSIQFDPAFIEESVFLFLKNKDKDTVLARRFHSEREKIYEQALYRSAAPVPGDAPGTGQAPPPVDREKAFQDFYKDFFEKLELNKIFEDACREFPSLIGPRILIFIKKVWTKKEETSELYTRGGTKTVWLTLQALRILDCSFLERFLRFELQHISDMLDPQFQYSPYVDLNGKNGIEDNLIRDRFRFLWDFYVDVRLEQKGHQIFKPLEQWREELREAFYFMGHEKTEKILREITNNGRLTQGELLEFISSEKPVHV